MSFTISWQTLIEGCILFTAVIQAHQLFRFSAIEKRLEVIEVITVKKHVGMAISAMGPDGLMKKIFDSTEEKGKSDGDSGGDKP